MNPFAEQEAWEDHQIGNFCFNSFLLTSHFLTIHWFKWLCLLVC